jgi:hypothetical protein
LYKNSEDDVFVPLAATILQHAGGGGAEGDAALERDLTRELLRL